MTRGFEGTRLTEIEEIFVQDDDDHSSSAGARLRQRLLANAPASPSASSAALRERLFSGK